MDLQECKHCRLWVHPKDLALTHAITTTGQTVEYPICDKCYRWPNWVETIHRRKYSRPQPHNTP